MQKINFIIAGAQKCGTSALAEYLRQHPDIFVAEQEGHFFDRESNFEPAKVDYSYYHQLFKGSEERSCVAESTPVYLYWKPAAKRIFEYNPSIKLVVLLRCPVARAYSAWNMEKNRGRENKSFEEAVELEVSRLTKGLLEQHRVASYIDRGFYARQLKHLWENFPRAQTLILPSKQLRQSCPQILQEICSFLDIPAFQSIKTQQAHIGSYASPIPQHEKETLSAIFHDDSRQLEQLLGWNSKYWLD